MAEVEGGGGGARATSRHGQAAFKRMFWIFQMAIEFEILPNIHHRVAEMINHWLNVIERVGGYYRRLVPPLNHHSFSHFLCFLQHQHEQRTRITIPGQPLFSRLALARARLTNDRLGAPPHTTRQLIPSTSAHRDPDLITSPLFIIQISSGRSATSMRASQFRFGKYGHVRSRSGLAD